VHISAPLDHVWEVLTNVEDWPRWTTSMDTVQRLDVGPLQVGSSARVEQPKLRPAVWTVTELERLHTFTWVAHQPGVRITGVHTLTREPDGRVRLDLTAAGSGPLARMADMIMGKRVRNYVQLEAAGLKAAAEAANPQA
jgi:uncharacterized membrane protein